MCTVGPKGREEDKRERGGGQLPLVENTLLKPIITPNTESNQFMRILRPREEVMSMAKGKHSPILTHKLQPN